jgi:hypothetical protein
LFAKEKKMKCRLIFAALLCCLLFFTGLNASAQDASPLPAPDKSTSALPAPNKGVSPVPGPETDKSSTIPDPSKTTSALAPIKSAGSTGGSTSGRGSSRTRDPAPAASARQAASTRQQAASDQQQAASGQEEDESSQDGVPNRGWYWGFAASAGEFSYETDDFDDLHGKGSYAGSILLGADLGLFALQSEIQITSENAKYEQPSWNGSYWDAYGVEVSGMLLRIPLLFKLDLHVWRILLQPYAGIYFNIGLGDLEWNADSRGDSGTVEHENSLLGVTYGGILGFRIGRGYLFGEFRYAGDLDITTVKTDGSEREFERSSTMLTLGYMRYF